MKTLSQQTIKNIKISRREGLSYKGIAKTFQLISSTIYKYSKSVVLSGEQQNLLNLNEKENWQKFASVYSVPKEILLPEIDEDFIFVLSHLFFDGSVPKPYNGNYIMNYTNSSLELINEFISKFKKCFGVENLKIEKTKGINVDWWYQVAFFSKKTHEFLLSIAPTFSTNNSARVPKFIFSLNEKLISVFLQAFWDDEGCASSHVFGCSKSEKMIDDLILLHETLGIKCLKGKKSNGCFRLILRSNYNNLVKFAKKVNFSTSIVTKGKHVGRYKRDVLNDIILSKSFKKPLKPLADEISIIGPLAQLAEHLFEQ